MDFDLSVLPLIRVRNVRIANRIEVEGIAVNEVGRRIEAQRGVHCLRVMGEIVLRSWDRIATARLEKEPRAAWSEDSLFAPFSRTAVTRLVALPE